MKPPIDDEVLFSALLDDLPARAEHIQKVCPEIVTVGDFRRLHRSADVYRIPNVGRKTIRDILDFIGPPPAPPRPRVVDFPVECRRSVARVLGSARKADLKDIIVIGYDHDGKFWTDVNLVDGGNLLWMVELFKARLMARGIEIMMEETKG